MVKVKCVICGSFWYTASPQHVLCKCGGRLNRLKAAMRDNKITLDEEALKVFDFSDLLNNDWYRLLRPYE